MRWSKNTREICKKPFSRLSLLTKLKFVGVKIEDLIEVYMLYIRSKTEYCCVVYHSRLTAEDSATIERIQKCCWRIILGDNYICYEAALEMTGLETLHERRKNRYLSYSLKAIEHPLNSRMFPLNPGSGLVTRQGEKLTVNFAHTDAYKMSRIPEETLSFKSVNMYPNIFICIFWMIV